ncbi:MAG: DUF1971 domain-containing protein [Parvibaculum sp.]|uniref:DUF1971 domain-containing protein n=1 Tax=Parvibaculum sp. TaxID=2024848 RepID=UPI003C721C3A
MSASLPPDAVAYKRTPVFDEYTVPAPLLHRHNTKAGVWGLLHILEGKLVYRTLDPVTEVVVDPSAPPVVIEPQALHEVALIGPVRFFVEFHSIPA